MQQLSLRPNSHSKGVPWCHTWYSLQINVLHPQNPILHHPFCNSSARTGGFDTTRDDSSDGRHPESSLPLNESNSSSLHRFRFGGGDGSFLRASNSSSSSDTSSWSLMGRVVDSSQLQMGSSPRQRLVLLAAARHAGVSELDMVERVKVNIGCLRSSGALTHQVSAGRALVELFV